MEEIQAMSDAEREIMKIIWDNGGSIYMAELLKQAEENGKNWKRTTIRTFITRLAEKGFIISMREGRMSQYKAAITEEEYLSGQAQTFIKEYFNGSIKHLLTSLLGQKKLGDHAVEELEQFWEKCKEEP